MLFGADAHHCRPEPSRSQRWRTVHAHPRSSLMLPFQQVAWRLGAKVVPVGMTEAALTWSVNSFFRSFPPSLTVLLDPAYSCASFHWFSSPGFGFSKLLQSLLLRFSLLEIVFIPATSARVGTAVILFSPGRDEQADWLQSRLDVTSYSGSGGYCMEIGY